MSRSAVAKGERALQFRVSAELASRMDVFLALRGETQQRFLERVVREAVSGEIFLPPLARRTSHAPAS